MLGGSGSAFRMLCIERGNSSRLGAFCGTCSHCENEGVRRADDEVSGSTRCAMEGCLDPEAVRDFESPRGTSSSWVGAPFRFFCTGGALGSRGFLGRRTLGASDTGAPSAFLDLTVEPGFRPGFFLGKPAAVRRTSGSVTGTSPNRGRDGSTMISSISISLFILFWVTVREVGSCTGAEGGGESSGDDLSFWCIEWLPPLVMIRTTGKMRA